MKSLPKPKWLSDLGYKLINKQYIYLVKNIIVREDDIKLIVSNRWKFITVGTQDGHMAWKLDNKFHVYEFDDVEDVYYEFDVDNYRFFSKILKRLETDEN
jgi:hypothetical protein